MEAIEKGCREFIIGLGGSSTNDAGVGMLQALGYQFFDQEGTNIGLGGVELKHITKIDESNVLEQVKRAKFRVACDVNNPLYGLNGAAYFRCGCSRWIGCGICRFFTG